VITKVLAVRKVLGEIKVPIVAEIDNPQLAKALAQAADGDVQIIGTQGIVARVTAQACRQPGLSNVVLDLLDFGGDEIYFAEIPEIGKLTYLDVLQAFEECSVIGLRDAQGSISLNPSIHEVIASGTQAIVIAEQSGKAIFSGLSKVVAPNFKKPTLAKPQAQKILVVGWSSMGKNIVRELEGFLPAGSSVDILANSSFVNPKDFESLKFKNFSVTLAESNGLSDELVIRAQAKPYDQVLLLGYREGISESEADANTLLALLQLKSLFRSPSFVGKPARVTAELLDSRKVSIAQIDEDDDLVVSDDIAALLVAQTSENFELAKVFDELFDADGASLNLRALESYVQLGKEISFAELVASAAAASDSAIGYRTSTGAGESARVHLNPPKSKTFLPAAGDSLIVVGKN